MIKHKLSIERLIDEKHYQFLIPQQGTWDEVIAFAKNIIEHAQSEIAKAEEAKQVQELLKQE